MFRNLILSLTAAVGFTFSGAAPAQIFDYPPGVDPMDLFGPYAPPFVGPVAPTPTIPSGVVLTCPFQNGLAVTAQMGPNHTGQFTRLNGANRVVDVWFYRGDAVAATLRVPNGWFEGEKALSPGRDNRNVSMVLRDSAGLNRGELLLCADPAPFRLPAKASKEIIGSGCNMLSIAFQIDGTVYPAELYARTLGGISPQPCFR